MIGQILSFVQMIKNKGRLGTTESHGGNVPFISRCVMFFFTDILTFLILSFSPPTKVRKHKRKISKCHFSFILF